MIYTTQPEQEYFLEEGCHIIEILNSESSKNLSIARARGVPGETTKLHHLQADEYYYILEGVGAVEVGGTSKHRVSSGDVVQIRAGETQRITNISDFDLIFLCICTPKFRPELYTSLE